MDDHEERIRRFAYHIWLKEGRPQGRDAIHWDRARELVAIEDSQRATAKPVRRDWNDPTLAADTVEPAGPAANADELPTMTERGEQLGEQLNPPKRPARKQAAARRSSATKTTPKTTPKPRGASRPPPRTKQ